MKKYITVIATLLLLSVTPDAFPTRPPRISDWHVERAESFFKAEKYREAYYEYTQAIDLYLKTGNNAELKRLEYHAAISAAKGGLPAAERLLLSFIDSYSGSEYESPASLALGSLYLDNERYGEALRVFRNVDPSQLTPTQQDDYHFKRGYAYFKTENWDMVYQYMAKIGSESIYWTHAQYCIGYADYRAGNYASARNYFSKIASEPAYVSILPFYIIQIEFADGNFGYVTENAPKILSSAKGERVTELLRMTGESWFHLSGWNETRNYINQYEQHGGAMGREEYYLLGFSAYMLKDYGAAESYLARVAGADDKLSQNASYHLADSYLKLGDKQRAMQSFAIASTRGYDEQISEDALFNYGKLQYELGGGHFNEAINILNRYLSLYPDSPRKGEVREYLVAAYYNSNDFEAAYNAIMQMNDPDNDIKAALQKITYYRALEFYGKGDMDEAWRWLEISLKNRFNPKYTALAGFWQGELLFREGKYKEAAEKYAAYLRVAPKNEKENLLARYNLGYAYFNQKDWSNARKWFEDFLNVYTTKDGYRADAFNRMGDIDYSGRSYWKAIEQYDTAAKLGTEERFYSAYQRAIMLGMVDRVTRKTESLNDIIQKGESPYVEMAMYELGRTYISQGQFGDAESTLKTYIAKYPGSPRYAAALSDLGLVYQNLGKQDEALEWYKKAVLAGRNTEQGRSALNNVRNIYVEKSDADAYFDYAQQMGIETDLGTMQRDSIAFSAARSAFLSGNKEKAAEALSEYLQKYPNGTYVAEALYYSGENALERNRKDAAFGHFQRLTQMYVNEFTQRGLEKLAPLALERSDYTLAADTYRKLADSYTNTAKQAEAWDGYINAVVSKNDPAATIKAADEILGRTIDKQTVRKANFAKAKAFEKLGNTTEAMKLYETLRTDTASPEGAESAYIVIRNAYSSGDKERAEKLILEFSKSDTTRHYWLAKAFLTLGDIYADKGDKFQARATFQSIVDGYSDQNDGIIEEARQRISGLK